jgi:hypothetical protein
MSVPFEIGVDYYSDRRWRLNNLYFITDKGGRRVKFTMNTAQQTLFEHMHTQNVILKARQRGFTTFIQLVMLDACVFNSDIRAGTIAHTLPDAQVIFRDKIRFPYDNLPDGLKHARPAENDNACELLLGNNSSIRVGVSLRSGTLQYLHISEYGKICAKFPQKAREVRSGALNTVDKNGLVFIESTAEGQDGHFFELCRNARTRRNTGEKLTAMDFKFTSRPGTTTRPRRCRPDRWISRPRISITSRDWAVAASPSPRSSRPGTSRRPSSSRAT